MTTQNPNWCVTVHSPADRQTLATLVAECRHQLAGHLDVETTTSVCKRLWELGTIATTGQGRPMRLVVDAASAAMATLDELDEPSVTIEGFPADTAPSPLAQAS